MQPHWSLLIASQRKLALIDIPRSGSSRPNPFDSSRLYCPTMQMTSAGLQKSVVWYKPMPKHCEHAVNGIFLVAYIWRDISPSWME